MGWRRWDWVGQNGCRPGDLAVAFWDTSPGAMPGGLPSHWRPPLPGGGSRAATYPVADSHQARVNDGRTEERGTVIQRINRDLSDMGPARRPLWEGPDLGRPPAGRPALTNGESVLTGTSSGVRCALQWNTRVVWRLYVSAWDHSPVPNITGICSVSWELVLKVLPVLCQRVTLNTIQCVTFISGVRWPALQWPLLVSGHCATARPVV